MRLIDGAAEHQNAVAIVSDNQSYPYSQLLESSAAVASRLLAGDADVEQARVAFLIAPGFDYAAVQWGIWRAGGVAVPLAIGHPEPELAWVLDDAQVSAVVASQSTVDQLGSLARGCGIPLIAAEEAMHATCVDLPNVAPDRHAMILYTSGTTNRPKGVVSTHAVIEAQVSSLVEAWEWQSADYILHVLPLHHIHGIINVLSCALSARATCEFQSPFSAAAVWKRFAAGNLTLFMAVPTIYAKLIAEWPQLSDELQQAAVSGCRQVRLMVSGSAALPVQVLETWREITGHTLLERYGMTEIGMALSNPLRGERVPGHVGRPLPGVEVRRVDESGKPVAADTPGEIEVRGPIVFREYWNRPDATAESFRDDWFRTGDIAVEDAGGFRILGRSSVDIIKTGGFKVSALEIEDVLRNHDRISECAVVGVPDDEWGERVAACVVVDESCSLTLVALRDWAKDRIAGYKIPSRLLVVPEIPRNAMGKVQKPAVRELFEASGRPET